VPVHDDRKLFEFLILEGAQAGLSWTTILKKRKNYRKALTIEPDDADTHYNFALALKYKGEAKAAVEEFEAALRLKSNWADAHYGLGASLYDLKDFPGSLKELRAAIALDPKNAGAHRLLARIYTQQNNDAAAERELRRSNLCR